MGEKRLSKDDKLLLDRATAHVRHWRDLLGLRRWHISIGVVRREEMHLRNRAAEVTTCLAHRSIGISLCSVHDYEFALRDVEENIVHELLHPIFEGWRERPDSYTDKLKEQTVQDLAQLLLKLDKQGRANAKIESAVSVVRREAAVGE